MGNIMPSSVPTKLALICPAFSDQFVGRPMRLPALERLLAYSDAPSQSVTLARELDTWQYELGQALALADMTCYPSAPLTWLGAGGNREPGTWLHADPAVQAISAHGLTMRPSASWTAQSFAVVESLVRDHLAADQMQLRSIGGHAMLQIKTTIDVRTTTLFQASQMEMQEALPTGPSGTTVRRIMNELQMLLYEKLDSVVPNTASPNAIWLWGAGETPSLSERALPSMWTNDDYTRGIYLAHGAAARCASLSTVDALLEQSQKSNLLAVVREYDPEQLEQQWFAPLLRALDQGRLSMVEIYLDGWQLRAKRSLLRRMFARPRPLAEWMH
jgi:hypothetical protein